MASAQVDRLSRDATSDLTGKHPGIEHVASGSFPPTDANLLREAALRSLRARKQTLTRPQTPTAVQPVDDAPPPGTTKNAVDLDGDVQMNETTAVSVRTGTPGTPSLSVATEDGEILEDGQISDTGGDITPGPEKRETTPRPSSDLGDKQDSALASLPTAVQPNGAVDTLPPSAERSQVGSESSPYVRPSLKMTAADLDEAKRLILDLLGLGVKPEYLVDCGISPQCLAVCFYELNLRFPLNLDRRQVRSIFTLNTVSIIEDFQVNLPPYYDLDKHMSDSLRRVQIIQQRDLNRASPKSPDLAAASLRPLGSPAPEGSATHILKAPSLPTSSSLPPRPIPHPPQSLEPREQPVDLIAAVVPPRIAALRPPPTGPRAMREGLDAATIEDQRRMELLARKAAMDSITRKRAVKSSPNPGLVDSTPGAQPAALEIQDVDSAVDALLADVRLNSVSVPSEQTDGEFIKGSPSQYDEDEPSEPNEGMDEALADYDSDAMVEDELHAPSPSYSDAEEKSILLTPNFDAARNLSPDSMSPDALAPLALPKSPSLPPNARVRFETPDAPASFLQHSTVAVPVAARKSRPIASDFIDQMPPRSVTVPAKEPERQVLLKRKRSFVDPQMRLLGGYNQARAVLQLLAGVALSEGEVGAEATGRTREVETWRRRCYSKKNSKSRR
ncbi:hypothetical protein BDV93DRAFT_13155 [Ceratobasidium sp. AG-I]|nr:hypothetical protein BDV93DRAFT_13155 [Ceratobasidium sp. AG-I]